MIKVKNKNSSFQYLSTKDCGYCRYWLVWLNELNKERPKPTAAITIWRYSMIIILCTVAHLSKLPLTVIALW